MKKKTCWKLALDALMLLALPLLFNKRAVNLPFHMAGGVVLYLLFLVHLGLNFPWIRAMTRKLFAPATSARLRFSYILDAVLFLCFSIIVGTGVVMHAQEGHGVWQTLHYFCSALALVCFGVHLGLHFPYFKALLAKKVRLPKVLGRVLAGVLGGALFAFGCYSLVTSDFGSWLARPFRSGQMAGMPEMSEEQRQAWAQARAQQDGAEGRPAEGMRRGEGERGGHGEMELFDPARALSTFAAYLSISFVFAVFSALGAWLLERRRKPAPAV